MKPVFSLLLGLFVSVNTYPCSIFTYSIDGRVYFCGNEDWIMKDPAIRTYPPSGKDYGYIIIGWKSFLPNYAQAGMNSEGLCFDWAAVPPQGFVRDATKREASLDITIDMLKKCGSVDEAIGLIRRYDISHFAE